MSVSFSHSHGAEAPIAVPAIGLDLFVPLPPAVSGGKFCFIETINAPGQGTATGSPSGGRVRLTASST